ncbi:hypothetical protein [Neorhizobium sp. S3-V5DH]|uniref:hypothetical protein n=1 Tax=Neorhizobium sp. S3-V5DH TaxID=2485166 RepID=UPI00105026FD|nr:hypothetical protein [Neorhizobium sp. S3-V5DH]TCV62291.1 hypothetical protein EDE09_12455 [Neorhizobium sp. S3-V5DH]
MSRKYRPLTQEETDALVAFAAAHGRRWKAILSEVYWYNARLWSDSSGNRVGSVLHGLRNEFGPTWLFDHCKLPKADQ